MARPALPDRCGGLGKVVAASGDAGLLDGKPRSRHSKYWASTAAGDSDEGCTYHVLRQGRRRVDDAAASRRGAVREHVKEHVREQWTEPRSAEGAGFSAAARGVVLRGYCSRHGEAEGRD